MKDPELRSVSSGARGLWIDMLSLMFECDRRGHLTVNGKPVSAEMLARMTGVSTDDVSRYLQELDNSGVFSRSDDGTIYSRRLVRDENDRANLRERVANHRKHKKSVTLPVTGDVTGKSDYDSVSELGVVLDVGSKSKPTMEEVRAYCAERGNKIDSGQWYDHYQANGWKIGRAAMKDWKASVRNWERNGNGRDAKGHKPSKAEERTARNRQAIVTGIFGDISADAGLSRQDDELRVDAGRGQTLEHETHGLLRGRH